MRSRWRTLLTLALAGVLLSATAAAADAAAAEAESYAYAYAYTGDEVKLDKGESRPASEEEADADDIYDQTGAENGFSFSELTDADRQIIRDRRDKLRKSRNTMEIDFVRFAISSCIRFTAARYSLSVPEMHEPSQSLPLAHFSNHSVDRPGIDLSTMSSSAPLLNLFLKLDDMFEQNKTYELQQHSPGLSLIEDYTESQDDAAGNAGLSDNARERGTERDYQMYRFRRFLTRVLSKLAVNFVSRDNDGVNLLTTRVDRFQYLLVGKFKLGALNREVQPQFSTRVSAEFLYTPTGLQVPAVIMSAEEANVTAWLDVTVLDSNEIAPLIDRPGPFSVSINESTLLFTELLRVAVTDSDVTDPRSVRCHVSAVDSSNELAQRLLSGRRVDLPSETTLLNTVTRCAFFVASRIDIGALCSAFSSPIATSNCTDSVTQRGYAEFEYAIYVDNTPSLAPTSLASASTSNSLSYETLFVRVYATNRHTPKLVQASSTTPAGPTWRNLSEPGVPFERVLLDQVARNSADFVLGSWTVMDADSGIFGRISRCTLLRNSLESQPQTQARPTSVSAQIAANIRIRSSSSTRSPSRTDCSLVLDGKELMRRVSSAQLTQERLFLETLPFDMLVDSDLLDVQRINESLFELGATDTDTNRLDALLRTSCRVADRFNTGAFVRICGVVNVTDGGKPALSGYYLVRTRYALSNISALRTFVAQPKMDLKAIGPSAIAAFCLRFRQVTREYQTSSVAVNLLLGDLPGLMNGCVDTEYSDVRFDFETQPPATSANWSLIGAPPGADPAVRSAAALFEIDVRLNKLRMRQPLSDDELAVLGRRTGSRLQLLLRVSVLARVADARRAALGWHSPTLATAYVRITVQLPILAVAGRVTRAVRLRTDAPANSIITRLPLPPTVSTVSGIAYSGAPAWCADLFDLDPLTGILRLRRELVGDMLEVIDPNFECAFRPPRASLLPAVSIDVNVVLGYVNNLPPRFNVTRRGQRNSTVSVSVNVDEQPVLMAARVAENRPPGTLVTVLGAHDPDSVQSASLARFIPAADRRAAARSLATQHPNGVRYSIRGGDGLGRFTLEQNGTLRSLESFDYESVSSYWLLVCVEDLWPVAPRNSCAVLVVEIGNENDCSPMPVTPFYGGSTTNCVREQQTYSEVQLRRAGLWKPCRATRSIVRISAYDFDSLNGVDSLTNTYSESFVFDTQQLNDAAADRLFFEDETQNDASVSDNEDDDERLTNNMMNLRSPFDDLLFDDTAYLVIDARRAPKVEAEPGESAAPTTTLRRAPRKRNEFEYRIVDGDPLGLFQVGPDGTVAVRLNATFDYEHTSEYMLTVLIIDSLSPSGGTSRRLTGTTYVEVKVADVAEVRPICFPQAAPIRIPRIDQVPTQLVQIGGYHIDSTAASLEISTKKQYEMVNGTKRDLAENLFTVVYGTGAVLNRLPLTAVGHTFGVSVWLRNRGRSVECSVEFEISDYPATLVTRTTTSSPEQVASSADTDQVVAYEPAFRFDRTDYKLFMSEGTPPGSFLLHIVVLSADGIESNSSSAPPRYCVLTEDTSASLYVDAVTCSVYLSKPLDHEALSQVDNSVTFAVTLTDFRTIFDRTSVSVVTLDQLELRPRFANAVEWVRLVEVVPDEPISRVPDVIDDNEDASVSYSIDAVYSTSMTADSDRLVLTNNLFSVTGDRIMHSLVITQQWLAYVSDRRPQPTRFDVFVRVTKSPIVAPASRAQDGIYVVSGDNPSRFDIVHVVVLLTPDPALDALTQLKIDCSTHTTLDAFAPWFIDTSTSGSTVVVRTAAIASALLPEDYTLVAVTCPITRITASSAALTAVQVDRFGGIVTTSASGLRRLGELGSVGFQFDLLNGAQLNVTVQVNELPDVIPAYPDWVDSLALVDAFADLQPTVQLDRRSACIASDVQVEEPLLIGNFSVSFALAGRSLAFASDSKNFALQPFGVEAAIPNLVIDLNQASLFWHSTPASALDYSTSTQVGIEFHNVLRTETVIRDTMHIRTPQRSVLPALEYVLQLRETNQLNTSLSHGRSCGRIPQLSSDVIGVTLDSNDLFVIESTGSKLIGNSYRLCTTSHLDFDSLVQTTFLLPLSLRIRSRDCDGTDAGARTEQAALYVAVADENDNQPLVTLVTYAEFDGIGRRKSPDGRIEPSSTSTPQAAFVKLANVPESIAVDTLLVRIVATDRDTDAKLEFRILVCQPEEVECPFEIRADSGTSVSSNSTVRSTVFTAELRSRKPLDYETVGSYSILIEVVDSVMPSGASPSSGSAKLHRAFVNVSINLLNVNDNAPQIMAGPNGTLSLRVVMSSFARRDLSDFTLYAFQIYDPDDQPPRLGTSTNGSVPRLPDYASLYSLKLITSNCSDWFGLLRLRLVNRIGFDSIRAAVAANWSNPVDEVALDRVSNHDLMCEMSIRVLDRSMSPSAPLPVADTIVRLTVVFDDAAFGVRVARNGSVETVEIGVGDAQLTSSYNSPDLNSFAPFLERYTPYFGVTSTMNVSFVAPMTRKVLAAAEDDVTRIRIERLVVALRSSRRSIAPGASLTVADAVLVGARPSLPTEMRKQVADMFRMHDDTLYAYWPADPTQLVDAVGRDVSFGVNTLTFKLTVAYRSTLAGSMRRQVTIHFPVFVRATTVDRVALASFGVVVEMALRFDQFASRNLDVELFEYARRRMTSSSGYVPPPTGSLSRSRRQSRQAGPYTDSNVYFVGYGPSRSMADGVQTVWVATSLGDRAALARVFGDRSTIYHLSRVNVTSVRFASERTDLAVCAGRCVMNNTRECLSVIDFDSRLQYAAIERNNGLRTGLQSLSKYKLLYPPVYDTHRCACADYAVGETCSTSLLNCFQNAQFAQDNYALCHRFASQYRSTPSPEDDELEEDVAVAGAIVTPGGVDNFLNVPFNVVVIVLITAVVVILTLFAILLCQCYRRRIFCFDKGARPLQQDSAADVDGMRHLLAPGQYDGSTMASMRTTPKPTVVLFDGAGLNGGTLRTVDGSPLVTSMCVSPTLRLPTASTCPCARQRRNLHGAAPNSDGSGTLGDQMSLGSDCVSLANSIATHAYHQPCPVHSQAPLQRRVSVSRAPDTASVVRDPSSLMTSSVHSAQLSSEPLAFERSQYAANVNSMTLNGANVYPLATLSRGVALHNRSATATTAQQLGYTAPESNSQMAPLGVAPHGTAPNGRAALSTARRGQHTRESLLRKLFRSNKRGRREAPEAHTLLDAEQNPTTFVRQTTSLDALASYTLRRPVHPSFGFTQPPGQHAPHCALATPTDVHTHAVMHNGQQLYMLCHCSAGQASLHDAMGVSMNMNVHANTDANMNVCYHTSALNGDLQMAGATPSSDPRTPHFARYSYPIADNIVANILPADTDANVGVHADERTDADTDTGGQQQRTEDANQHSALNWNASRTSDSQQSTTSGTSNSGNESAPLEVMKVAVVTMPNADGRPMGKPSMIELRSVNSKSHLFRQPDVIPFGEQGVSIPPSMTSSYAEQVLNGASNGGQNCTSRNGGNCGSPVQLTVVPNVGVSVEVDVHAEREADTNTQNGQVPNGSLRYKRSTQQPQQAGTVTAASSHSTLTSEPPQRPPAAADHDHDDERALQH